MSDIIRLRDGEKIRVDEFPPGYLDGLNERLDVLGELSAIDELQRLDFDARCDVRVEDAVKIFGLIIRRSTSLPCTEPAHWIVSCLRCGHTGLVCDPHRDQVIGYSSIICAECKAKGKPADMVRFDPIPSGS